LKRWLAGCRLAEENSLLRWQAWIFFPYEECTSQERPGREAVFDSQSRKRSPQSNQQIVSQLKPVKFLNFLRLVWWLTKWLTINCLCQSLQRGLKPDLAARSQLGRWMARSGSIEQLRAGHHPDFWPGPFPRWNSCPAWRQPVSRRRQPSPYLRTGSWLAQPWSRDPEWPNFFRTSLSQDHRHISPAQPWRSWPNLKE